MHRPIDIAIEWPTRADLRNPRFWFVVALALAGIVAVILLVRAILPRPAQVAVASASLAITSTPTGATIIIGGRERGRTPATLALPPGEHRVTLRLAGRADTTYTVRLAADQATSLAGILWQDIPEAQRIRPPLPGATIAAAHFLADGRVALAVALPAGDERQLWLIGRDGTARRVGPPLARVAIAAAPDGSRVAYLSRPTAGAPGAAPGIGDTGLATEVWITARDGERGERRYALPPNTAAEHLVDLSWSPDGSGLLLASQQRPQGGGVRTRLLRLALPADGQVTPAPRELITLPSEVVPGADAWSPAGDRVALLARADGRTTLCLLAIADGPFRSLADVATDGHPAPPFPPLSWRGAGDGVGTPLAYAAPPPGGAGGPTFGSAPAPRLAIDGILGDRASDLGAAEGLGPGWRGDDLILALSRPGRGGATVLRAFDPRAGGAGQDLGALPSAIGTPDGMRWDMARAQALLAVRGAGGGQFDLWLVRWAVREEEVGR